MENLREKLISAYKENCFLKNVYELYENLGNDRKYLGQEIALLHNMGEFDAIAEFRKLSNDSKEIDFFQTRKVFEDALPEIKAPVAQVMDCVKHLIDEAKKDMAAMWVLTSFEKYCAIELSRPQEVLQIVENDVDKWLYFIAPAIISGSILQLSEYVAKAIFLTKHKNLEARLQAIFAIEKLNYCHNSMLLMNAFKSLKSIIESEIDCRLISSAMKSAYYLFISDKNMESDVIQLIKIALSNKDDFVLYTASELLFLNRTNIPAELLDILLDALKNINPQEKATLANIDYGLQYLIRSNQEEKVYLFLENILIKNTSLSIRAFTSLTNDLYKNSQTLKKIVTRWFLSKNIPLYKAAMEIIQSVPGNDIILNADTEQITKQPEGICLFIVIKAIGWLFNSPVSCTSFIISLIDISSNNELEQIERLLFYPLIINYPGKAKQYLIDVKAKSSPRIQSIISKVLIKLENYQTDLRAAGAITELLPSLYQKETFMKHFNQQFAKSYKEAQKNSLVNMICSKSVLLYGQKSINYFQAQNNQMVRIETPLQTISHSTEIANLLNIDPHGLDSLLFSFRFLECENETYS